MSPTPSRYRWCKLHVGVIKINWDAALAASTKTIRVGIIACDEKGSVVAALCTTVLFITDPSFAETFTACKAIEFYELQEFNRIILEGDTLSVVQALRTKEPSWLWYGQLIKDCRARLNNFQFWNVSHTRRETNEATYHLAKFAFHQSLYKIWERIYFNIIQNFILTE